MIGLEHEDTGWTQEAGDKEELAQYTQELLVEKADMLRQYFSIYVDKKGYLKTLPMLIGNAFIGFDQLDIKSNINRFFFF